MICSKTLLALLLLLFFSPSRAQPPIFDLPGFYGRFLQLVTDPSPADFCSTLIRYRDPPDQLPPAPHDTRRLSVRHDAITHDGYQCTSGSTELHEHPPDNPAPGVGVSDTLFHTLSPAAQLWIGRTVRECGPWNLSDPTAVFMVFDQHQTLEGPFTSPLPPNHRYIIFSNSLFTCAYRNIPPTANPSPTNSATPSVSPSLSPSLTPSSSTSPSPSHTPAASTLLSVSPSLSPSQSTQTSPIQTPSSSLSPSTSPEPSSSNSSSAVCFPANAVVQLEDGSSKTMEDLRVHDRVLVAFRNSTTPIYSSVFLFTHRHHSVHFNFVRICARSHACIRLTPGHFIYVRLSCNRPFETLMPARKVLPGHCVHLSDALWHPVHIVSSVVSNGLFNPQTVHGDIYVDGVRASTYTSFIPPKTAHSLLAPLRVAYSVLRSFTRTRLSSDNTL